MSELLNCPFCGSKAKLMSGYYNDFAECTNCGIDAEKDHWNTRADHIVDANKKVNCPELPDSWISVDDRLPDDNGWYLVHHSGGMLFSRELIDGTYFKSKKLWANAKADKYGQITHWQPLPEPPL